MFVEIDNKFKVEVSWCSEGSNSLFENISICFCPGLSFQVMKNNLVIIINKDYNSVIIQVNLIWL